jgi:hypothetical protein
MLALTLRASYSVPAPGDAQERRVLDAALVAPRLQRIAEGKKSVSARPWSSPSAGA